MTCHCFSMYQIGMWGSTIRLLLCCCKPCKIQEQIQWEVEACWLCMWSCGYTRPCPIHCSACSQLCRRTKSMTKGPSAGKGCPPVNMAVTRSGVQFSASTQHFRADAAACLACRAKKPGDWQKKCVDFVISRGASLMAWHPGSSVYICFYMGLQRKLLRVR